MKIATWNVNSVKARLEHVLRWLDDFQPDVALLQEIKSTEETFPREPIGDKGYNIAISGQKTYNGVAILSKYPIGVELTALPGDANDDQARYIEAFTGSARVASIYLPNGNPTDSEKFTYKLKWLERLHKHVGDLLKTEDAFVLGGDYNVTPDDRDAFDPVGWANDAQLRPESRAAFRKILHLGVVEAWRALHGGEEGKYSWWDYRAGAWNKDNGLRIDHILLSPQAADRLVACEIDKTPRGWEKASDHTPVWVEIED